MCVFATNENVELVAAFHEKTNDLLVPHVNNGLTVDLNNVVALNKAGPFARRPLCYLDNMSASKIWSRVVQKTEAEFLPVLLLYAAGPQSFCGGLKRVPIDFSAVFHAGFSLGILLPTKQRGICQLLLTNALM